MSVVVLSAASDVLESREGWSAVVVQLGAAEDDPAIVGVLSSDSISGSIRAFRSIDQPAAGMCSQTEN